ncbi:MAG: 4Fe-4S binding protein [Thermoleophilia bacterium]|nr:4Fe-4S binding protein [Thermoleophilia bacterium]
MSDPWRRLTDDLAREGLCARVVPVERLADVRLRVSRALDDADLPSAVAAAVADDVAFDLPASARPWRSVVVFALARPLTRATLTWHGKEHTVPVPPHYAGYRSVPQAVARRVDELLRPDGYAAAHCEPALKTLAACAGLARYGRNNVAYVDGIGSWLQLGACVTDAPPPDDAIWGEPQLLERCERCTACLRACPTGAIGGERFLLHTERCLTYHNESRAAFPGWLEPSAHHAAVGCLRCQQACPEDRAAGLVEATPERFDEEETATILAAERDETAWAGLSPVTQAKLERCGLDYLPAVVARNLSLLLEA